MAQLAPGVRVFILNTGEYHDTAPHAVYASEAKAIAAMNAYVLRTWDEKCASSDYGSEAWISVCRVGSEVERQIEPSDDILAAQRTLHELERAEHEAKRIREEAESWEDAVSAAGERLKVKKAENSVYVNRPWGTQTLVDTGLRSGAHRVFA